MSPARLTVGYMLFVAGFVHPSIAAAEPPPAAETVEQADNGQAEDESISRRERIVVTARKREEDPGKLPTQVSLIDDRTIETAIVRNINDMDRLVPSLVNIDPGNPIESYPVIRGVGSNYGVGEFSVGMFTDGIYHGADSYYSQDVLDVERIEILKGPQTTLYGKSSIGGAISIVTKDPTMTPELESATTLGTDGLAWQSFVGNVPLLEEKLALRAAYEYRNFDGFYTNEFSGKSRDGEESQNFRFKLLVKPVRDLEIVAAISYRNLDGDTYFYHRVSDDRDYEGEPYDVDVPSNAEIEVSKFSNAVNWTMKNGYRFTSLTGVTRTEQDDIIDIDYGSAPPSDTDLFANLFVTRKNPRRGFSQEVRVSSPENRTISWQAGLFAFWLRDELDQQLVINTLASVPQPPSTDATRDSYTYSAFGELEWRFAQRGVLGAGLRYDYDIREIEDRVASPSDDRRTASNVAPTLTLSYDVTATGLVYARIASGSKAGGFNVGGFPPFEEERSTSSELGFKARFADRKVGVNGALFATELKDRQVVQIDLGTTTQFISNQGDARILGAELELVMRPTAGLTLNLAATVLDPEYTDFTTTTIGPGSVPDTYVLDGNDIPYVPRSDVTLAAEYGHAIRPGELLYGRLDFRATGVRYWDEFNVNRQEPRQTFDVSIGYRGRHVEVMAFVRNATDEQYFTNFVPEYRFPFAGTALGVNGRPRSAGVRLFLRF